MADFATRSLGIGYLGGTSLLFASLMAVLALALVARLISVETVSTPKVEAFYWAAITFRTLSERHLAIGLPMQASDKGGALVFGAGLAHWRQPISGDIRGAGRRLVDRKPLDQGGLAMSRPLASIRRRGLE